MKIETIAVHGGYSPDPTTKAVAVPIYQTTSYAFDDTQLGAEEMKKAGVPENMVRLSIGIEHIDDIKADLEQALAAV